MRYSCNERSESAENELRDPSESPGLPPRRFAASLPGGGPGMAEREVGVLTAVRPLPNTQNFR